MPISGKGNSTVQRPRGERNVVRLVGPQLLRADEGKRIRVWGEEAGEVDGARP